MSIDNTVTTIAHQITPEHPALADKQPEKAIEEEKPFWGEDGFTFSDLVDLVNPLQHIPVISNIYRAVTGDEVSSGAQVLGGGLFGGVVGLLASFFDVSMQQDDGKTLSEQAIAFFTGDDVEKIPVTAPVQMKHEIAVLDPVIVQSTASYSAALPKAATAYQHTELLDILHQEAQQQVNEKRLIDLTG